MTLLNRLRTRTGFVASLAVVALLYEAATGGLSTQDVRRRTRATAAIAGFEAKRTAGLVPTPDLPTEWEYTLRGRWALMRSMGADRSHVTIRPSRGGFRVAALVDEGGERSRTELTDEPIPFPEALDLAAEHVHGLVESDRTAP
ncbi:hypothetical protein [Natronorarus salvus]|uniref:hypothetical protein n=1 Tax=Natronorarus salvus TaxID=3117733 RepID=UPI002F26756A